jgi:hypothetical protein
VIWEEEGWGKKEEKEEKRKGQELGEENAEKNEELGKKWGKKAGEWWMGVDEWKVGENTLPEKEKKR